MGMVVMSKRELNHLEVLARLDSDRLTAQAAAELMKMTPRQTYRLLRRYRDAALRSANIFLQGQLPGMDRVVAGDAHDIKRHLNLRFQSLLYERGDVRVNIRRQSGSSASAPQFHGEGRARECQSGQGSDRSQVT
jgi:hypothetical protein